MNPLLKNIYYQRYGKILLVLIGLFTLIYVGSGISSVHSWHEQKDYLYSAKFSQIYNKDKDYQIKEYHYETPVYYRSIQEYRDSSLTIFYQSQSHYLPSAEETLSAHPDDSIALLEDDDNAYQIGNHYVTTLYNDISLVVFLVFCLGFLLFFIDQKTNFNRFLFSLSFKRRELFLGKIVYLALPLLGCLALVTFIYLITIYLGIPKPYMNVTLTQLLYSGFSHWIYLVFALTAGSLFGTMLGNLVFSILSTLAGIFLLVENSTWAYSNLNLLITNFFPKVRFISLSALLVNIPGKTGTPLTFLAAMLLVSILFLYLSERIFHKVSLENNGQFVTSPEIRLPVCLSIIIGSFIFFGLLNINLTNTVPNDYPYIWRDLLIQTALIITTSVTLVYSHNIRNWWFAKRDLRMQQKL